MPSNIKMLNIQTNKVVGVLGCIAAVLVLLSLTTQIALYVFGYSEYPGLFTELNVDSEANIPTYYSTIILALCSLFLGLIGLSKKEEKDRYRFHWILLAILFLVISMDEAAAIHERFIAPIRYLLGVSGWFYFAWVIPGIVFVLVLAIFYLKFLISLPARTRSLFILAAILYLSGVIVMELIGGKYFDEFGGENLTYSMITTVEEVLEMTGIIIFIYALMEYLNLSGIQIRFGERLGD